jgi:DNA polymerase IV
MQRQILHLDLDAFYASVEQLDHPELRGKPVIVGGVSDRGVVCACSYEARRFGVRSAMGMVRARNLCPAAIVRPVRMRRYRELSEQVFAIFRRYTDRIEPLSIDEAFLDVSGCERLFGPPAAIAAAIRTAVKQETGLTVSAGVAGNKLLAKLASERGKPNGLVEILPQQVEAFLAGLPVASLWGVGRVTAERLQQSGLLKVGDLRKAGEGRLVQLLGSFGAQLYRLSLGEDERPVEASGAPKSVGHEETFAEDTWDRLQLERELLAMAEQVASRLRALGLEANCVTVKVKYGDFVQVTRSATLPAAVSSLEGIHPLAKALLGRTEAGCRPVRLLGLSLSQLQPPGAGQIELFGREQRLRQQSLDQALDRVRQRFGRDGVVRGSLLPQPSVPEAGDGGD